MRADCDSIQVKKWRDENLDRMANAAAVVFKLCFDPFYLFFSLDNPANLAYG